MLALSAQLPPAYWDAYLLDRFPGKTLEELDQIDWGRYMRAQHVRHIDQIELNRENYFHSKYKPTPADLAAWAHHDRLLGNSDG